MRLAMITTAVTAVAIGLRYLRSGSFSPDLDTAPRVKIQLADDESVILGRLSAALSHKTVSSLAASDHILVPENFEALHATLFDAFPEAFKTLKLDVVSTGLLPCYVPPASLLHKLTAEPDAGEQVQPDADLAWQQPQAAEAAYSVHQPHRRGGRR